MENQPTNKEILEAINTFSEATDQRFENIEGRLEHVEKGMVTKNELIDILDEKLGDLRGDLVHLTRKEDTKLVTLVTTLRDKKVISDAEAKAIFSMAPFPNMPNF